MHSNQRLLEHGRYTKLQMYQHQSFLPRHINSPYHPRPIANPHAHPSHMESHDPLGQEDPGSPPLHSPSLVRSTQVKMNPPPSPSLHTTKKIPIS